MFSERMQVCASGHPAGILSKTVQPPSKHYSSCLTLDNDNETFDFSLFSAFSFAWQNTPLNYTLLFC